MVAPEQDEEWAKLAETEEVRREAQMIARYSELVDLSEAERKDRLRAMARAEYALPDEKLRPFVISRMRTWIALAPEKASVIARDYDAIMQELPAAAAMRRVSLVQTLVTEFSPEDEERLRELVPGVFAGAPNRRLPLETGAPLQTQAPVKKKAWWAFWRG